MTTKQVQSYFFIFLLLVLSFLFYNIIQSMLVNIILAFLLSYICSPISSLLVYRFKLSKSLSSTICIILILFFITFPSYFLIASLVKEISNINLNEFGANILAITNTPLFQTLAPYLPEFNLQQEDISQFLAPIFKAISSASGVIFQQTATQLFNFIIILYLSFFIIMDWKKIISRISTLSPLSREDNREFLHKIFNTINAIIFGTFFIAIAEGTYGMLLFQLLGISSPILWGFIMMILSIFPLVGTNAILIPAVVYQFISGNYIVGILLLVLGVGGVLISQNIVKVRIVGNKAKIPAPIIVLSTLGGIYWIGAIGFIVGPIIAGVFLVVLNQYTRKYNKNIN